MPLPPLAFVDLETTGATATADRITEIGMVLVDESGVSEWSTLVNPGGPIPPFITGLTGISDAMLADAPSFGEIAGEVMERLAGRLFIAHNARFDFGFLKNEFRRTGIDFRATVLCTVKLSRKLSPQHPRHNLDSLIARHGLVVGERHRALGDARLIHQLWQKLHAELPAERIEAAIAAVTARPSLPTHLDPAEIEALPEGPGVYLFYGENALPLYVGKSTGIRRRVLSHFAADHSTAKEMSLAQQVRRIECVETGGEIGALLKEAELVKRLQPTHNRILRRNAEECLWQLVEAGPGVWRPQLVLASEMVAVPEKLYGPFKTAREAKRVLAELARAHELCPALLGLESVKPGRPCFAHQLRQCRGACVGREPASFHSARLMAALERQRIAAWPFPGPAWLREGGEVLLFDAWRHLGSVRDDAELTELLGQPLPPFERDVYRILQTVAARLTPLR